MRVLSIPLAACLVSVFALAMPAAAQAETDDEVPGRPLLVDEPTRAQSPEVDEDTGPRGVDPTTDPALFEGLVLPYTASACVSIGTGALPFAGLAIGATAATAGQPLCALPCLGLAALSCAVGPLLETMALTSVANGTERWPEVELIDSSTVLAAYGSYMLAVVAYFAGSGGVLLGLALGASTGNLAFISSVDPSVASAVGLAMLAAGAVTLLMLQPVAPLAAYVLSSSAVRAGANASGPDAPGATASLLPASTRARDPDAPAEDRPTVRY